MEIKQPSDLRSLRYTPRFSDEGGNSRHSGQPLISARDTTVPTFFDVPQELPQQLRMDIGDKKIVHLSVKIGGCIDDQQAYGIAIASLRIARAIPLAVFVLAIERTQTNHYNC